MPELVFLFSGLLSTTASVTVSVTQTSLLEDGNVNTCPDDVDDVTLCPEVTLLLVTIFCSFVTIFSDVCCYTVRLQVYS